MGEGDTLLNALVGAAVTVVLSFVGVSPLLGGAVPGSPQRGDRMDGARVGAISGVLASIPFLLLLFLALGFLGVVTGLPLGPEAFGASLIGLVVVGFGLFVALAWSVGLSAVGGYLGVYVAEETEAGRSAAGSS
jgi:hypothetical protein